MWAPWTDQGFVDWGNRQGTHIPCLCVEACHDARLSVKWEIRESSKEGVRELNSTLDFQVLMRADWSR